MRQMIVIIIIIGLIVTGCNRPAPLTNNNIPDIEYSTEGFGSAIDGDILIVQETNSLLAIDITNHQVVKKIPIQSKYGALGFDISNDIVTWSDLSNEKRDVDQLGGIEKANADIFIYNLKTGEQKQITSDSGTQMNPKVWSNFIIWQDNRGDISREYPGKWSLYLYDLTSGREQMITSTLSAHATYNIHDFHIVWEDDRNNKATNVIRGGDNLPENNKDIFAFDIRTEEEISIAKGPFMESKPDVFGNNIVWEDRNKGKLNANIVLYNLNTKQKRQITNDNFNKADPRIYGDYVVWMDELRGTSSNDVYVNGKAPNSDIFLFNILTNSERRLTGDEPQILPNISSNWVSFTLSRQVDPKIQVVKYK